MRNRSGSASIRAVSGAMTLLALTARAAAAPPPVPATPAPARALLYARPFAVAVPFRYDWYPDLSPVRTGLLVVIEADPALVYPRQSPEPVLLAGHVLAQRVGMGWPSAIVVAIVPDTIDLERDPIWFGSPALPERLGAAAVLEERARAEAVGILPFPAGAVARAHAAGGDLLSVPDFTALGREAHDLFLRFTPDARVPAAD